MEEYRDFLKEILSQDSLLGPTELSIRLAGEIVDNLTDQQVARMMLAINAIRQNAIKSIASESKNA